MKRIAAIAFVVGLECLRQKALYVLLILVAALVLTLASVDVFQIGGVVRHVLDLGIMTAWILAWGVAVMVSVRQLPRAEKTGAVFSLLAKPISRAELLVGKWLGAWVLSAIAALAFCLMVMLIVILQGGQIDPASAVQFVLLQIAALAIICACGIALSTALGEDAAMAVTLLLTVGAYFILPRLPYLLAAIPAWQALPAYLFHYLAPHLEWFDMRQRLVHGWGPSPWHAVLIILGYGVLWSAAALFSGWLGYRNKRFNRDTA